MKGHKKYTGSLNPYFIKDGKTVKYCSRKKPIPLVYDLTHDNSTYEERGKAVLKTPICVITELSGAFIGSTKGFDQFYSKKIDVIEQGALYLHDLEILVTQCEQGTVKRKICLKWTKPENVV